MELRLLRYFLAVAEELHFARAAARLHMTQPPLSRQIRALERTLGVALFHRTKRKVVLTEAGMAFISAARKVLEQADSAVIVAQQAERGQIGRLEVTYTSSVPFTRLFSTVIRAYRRTFPGVQLALYEMTTARQLQALADRRIDVGFVRTPIHEQPKEIALVSLLREPLLVALRADHQLAHTEAIAAEQLAEELFILYPRDIGTGLYEQITEICRKAGFAPRVAQEAQQMAAIIALVSAGLGLSIVPTSVRNLAADGVVYRPLSSPFEQAELVLAYRQDENSPVARAFIDLTRALASAHDRHA